MSTAQLMIDTLRAAIHPGRLSVSVCQPREAIGDDGMAMLKASGFEVMENTEKVWLIYRSGRARTALDFG